MSTAIAISHQKGGVAKTTTCLSLGGALTEMGQSVLLVDLDPQANLTLSLGLDPRQLRRTVVDVLLGNDSLVGVSRESGVFGLDIAPANYELALADKVLYTRRNFQYRLREALGRLYPGLYDYILLDCPPALSPLTLNALTAADLTIIPVQCDAYADQSLRKTIRFVTQLGEQCNEHLIYRLLVTMYDQRNKISRIILNELQREYGPWLFETVIQVDTKLRESPRYGKPITAYAPRSRGALQYRALAQEIRRFEPLGSDVEDRDDG